MAKVLKTYRFPGRGGSSRDWAVLFDGQIWELTRGEDFECHPREFRRTVASAAQTRKVKIRTSVEGDDKFYLQAIIEDSK